jgi:hypothetical protein
VTTRRTAWRGALVGAAAAACLTACVQVPSAGPVVETKESVQPTPNQNPDNNPPPPQPGMTPTQIVNGFLEAMTATPLQTSTAQLFLTTTGRTLWEPQQSVVSYAALRPPPRGRTTVQVRLRGADRVGAGGQWMGRLGPAASQMSFPMRREDGQWRIAAAPNALLVPRTFYDQAFQDASLYFFDPSARILVPEVVHMPQGQQLATALVQALVLGPQPSLAGVVRTFIPPGLTVNPVVVTSGVADVTLRGPGTGPTSSRTTKLMLTQLAWTLRQDPSVRAFTVNIGGRQVTDAAGSSTFRVDNLSQRYDPSVPRGSSQLYALRRGRLVSGSTTQLTPVAGPFGTTDQGIGKFAVSLHDSLVAGTTSNALLVGPVRGAAKPTPVLTGTGLLRPAWDFSGRLWEVQNAGSGGAVVLYIARGRSHEVHVSGVTGQDVRRFLVSRDASRLVAVVHGAARDRLVVSRLRYDVHGHRVSGTRARALRWSAGTSTRIRDIGWWTSPTRIAVLDQVSDAQAEVRTLAVDGSTAPIEAPPIVIPGRAFSLVTSPTEQTPFAVQHGALFNLTQADTNSLQPVPGLHYFSYAG